MQSLITDNQGLKIAIIELLKSDAAFGQEVLNLLFGANGAKLVKWDTTTYIISPENKTPFYYDMQPKERQQKHLALQEKYRKKKGIRLEVIQALQEAFDDAPSAEDMIHLLKK